MSKRAWEGRPALEPFHISLETYRACRRARPYPQVDWGRFEDRLQIRVIRSSDGRPIVRVEEDTPAATAIREAMEDAAVIMAEDF